MSEKKKVLYRCSECGETWWYWLRGRPPKNCGICGEEDCMDRVKGTETPHE